MGQRSVEAEENVWPVFVDLLSTIVMVVTFLLIVMSIAISVISQNVAKSFIESMSEKTLQGGGDISAPGQLNASGEFAAKIQSEQLDPKAKSESSASAAESKSQSEAKTAAAETTPATPSSAAAKAAESKAADASSSSAVESDATESTPEPAKAAQDEARFTPELAEELKSAAQADDGKELSVLSRQAVSGEKRIVVTGLDRTTEEAATTSVARASSLLTLQFDPVGTRIDEPTSAAVGAFFTENAAAIKDRPLVIWSFANAQMVSVSEARRVAYYRALATRNELIKNGVLPENINVEIRFNENTESLNTVQIMATQ